MATRLLAASAGEGCLTGPGPSRGRDRSERVIFQERAQVVRGSLEVLPGQPDHERLGQLEETPALAAVEAGHPGTRRHRFHRGVDLDVERPGRALGRELLVLAQGGTDRGRLVAPPEERPAVDERGTWLERSFTPGLATFCRCARLLAARPRMTSASPSVQMITAPVPRSCPARPPS